MLPLLVLSSLLGAVASPAMAVDSCTALPSWTVSDFKSNSTDTVGAGGSASFTLTNNLTGTSDELSCNLQVNYRCIISGTPSDKNLTVHVAVRAGSLTFLLDEVVECPGRETPLHIIGTGDLQLDCDGVGIVGGRVVCSLKAGKDTIQGEAVELAPESSER